MYKTWLIIDLLMLPSIFQYLLYVKTECLGVYLRSACGLQKEFGPAFALLLHIQHAVES